jgi:hypothetical protein
MRAIGVAELDERRVELMRRGVLKLATRPLMAIVPRVEDPDGRLMRALLDEREEDT